MSYQSPERERRVGPHSSLTLRALREPQVWTAQSQTVRWPGHTQTI